MDRQKIARSAKWGAACAPCVVAKARCVRSNSLGAKCDRCQSLEKHCLDQVHRPRKERHAKSSKTAQLEDRLNSLIDSLKATEEGENSGSLSNRSQSHSSPSASTISPSQDTPSQDESVQSTSLSGTSSSVLASTPCSCSAPVKKEDLVHLESDETLLSIYRNQLCSRFPFVIIPLGTTAVHLEATRPLLLKVIRMVASVRHLRSIRGQSRAVMQHIAHAMLVKSERSLDLLQGILVFLGFYHYHCMTHAQFNNLNHLAVSLIGDMDLSTGTKSPERRSQLPLLRSQDDRSRTNEERRALVGVWYMSSNAALILKQLAPLSYTKHLDQCLRSIEDAAEYETDQLVVQLVRIQHLTNKIFHFHNRDQMVDELPSPPEVPVIVRLEAFQKELDRLWNAIPSNLKPDCEVPPEQKRITVVSLTRCVILDSLSCHYNSAYLRLFGPFLEGSHLPDTESQSLASLSLLGLSVFDIFSSFTATLKIWFDDWLAIPVCSYFYMPQPACAQSIHAAMMLSRWARVAGPSAVRLCRAGTTAPTKEASTPHQPLSAFSGVPPCPDLSVPQPQASLSTPVISPQLLDTLRAKVLTQQNLLVDIFGIADAMVIRFEAAKKEMEAAQGGVWENDTWDLAAAHIKMKKLKVEKWSEIVATVNRLTDASNGFDQGSGGAMNNSERRSIDHLDWLVSGNEQENWHWENDLFDEMMSDIHPEVILDTSGDWSTFILDDIGVMGGPTIEEGVRDRGFSSSSFLGRSI